MATVINSQQIITLAKQVLRSLIPIDTFWENVYRIDLSVKLDTDTYLMKFTWFNDQSMKLEISNRLMQDEMVIGIVEDDFEAWKAEAIMRCEAGEDFYERPKAVWPGGVSSGLSTVQTAQNALSRNHLQTIQQQSSMQQLGQATAKNPQGNSLWNTLTGGFFK